MLVTRLKSNMRVMQGPKKVPMKKIIVLSVVILLTVGQTRQPTVIPMAPPLENTPADPHSD
jgi:hypothetical protein